MTTNNKIYLTAAELAEMLGISRGHSYKLIQKMNAELSAKGYIVVAGKVPVKYFEERYFGFSAQRGGEKMPAYKDETQNTWYSQFYYVDWTGKRQKNIKIQKVL